MKPSVISVSVAGIPWNRRDSGRANHGGHDNDTSIEEATELRGRAHIIAKDTRKGRPVPVGQEPGQAIATSDDDKQRSAPTTNAAMSHPRSCGRYFHC